MSLGRNYRTLWLAAAISNLGDGIAITAMPLLAATLTRDPLLISGVAFAERLPWLLFSLHAGAIVDRVDRRRLMGYTDLVRAALIGVIGAALLTHTMRLWVLYLVVFALGSAETLFDNASQAMMPALVEPKDLERANARLYGAQIVTNEFVGPPTGGFLFALLAATPFIADAGSFVAASLLVLTLRGSFRVERSDPTSTIRADIGEGLRWLRDASLVRRMAISLGLFNLLSQIPFGVFVLFAIQILHVHGAAFGLLMTSGAIGSLLGSAIATRASRRLGAWALVIIAGLSGVCTVAIGALSNPYGVGALMALNACTGVIWNVITVSLRQRLIPAALLGRVNSAYRLIAWGAIPIGAIAGGVIARELGLRATFYISGGALVVAALVYMSRTVPDMRALRR